MSNYPDDAWVWTVCKAGQSEAGCRYLTIGPGGWSCLKLSSLREWPTD